MGPLDRLRGAARHKLLERIFSQRFEQHKAGFVCVPRCGLRGRHRAAHQRFIDKRLQFKRRRARHLRRSRRRPIAAEDGQATKDRALVLMQIPRVIEHRPQAAMPQRQIAQRRAEPIEALADIALNLGQRHCARGGGGELDRQWHAGDMLTNMGDRDQGRFIGQQARLHLLHTLHKQLDGAVPFERQRG